MTATLRGWPVALVLVAVAVAGCGAQSAAQGTLPPAQRVPAASTPQPDATADTTTDTDASAGDNAAVPAEPASTTTAPARTSSSSRAVLSSADRISFARLQARLGGRSGLAVSGLGVGQRVQRLGTLNNAIAWSTSKVPIAMAVYDAGLAGAQQQNLRAAITASDNAAAEKLWNALGAGTTAAASADAQLRAAGDTHTHIQPNQLRAGLSAFGQTTWPLTDQARFTAGMACLNAGAMVLGLMDQVVSGQRWGLGSAGVSAQLKGGWGPGVNPGAASGYLDRQMGVITIAGKPLAVTIANLPANGAHGAGISALTAIARWLVGHADVSRLPRTPRCT
jgi:hypothetical protein